MLRRCGNIKPSHFDQWRCVHRSELGHGRLAPQPDRHICRLQWAGWCSLQNSQCHRCRSEEHTSELQSLMRISYAVFCLKKKKQKNPKIIMRRLTYLLQQETTDYSSQQINYIQSNTSNLTSI